MATVQVYHGEITREMIWQAPNTIFVFGDNALHVGFGGQAAVARGLPNTLGIPTKWKPTVETDAFFTDNQFDQIKPLFDDCFRQLTVFRNENKPIIFFPQIGCGRAKLHKTAPRVYHYLLQLIGDFIGE